MTEYYVKWGPCNLRGSRYVFDMIVLSEGKITQYNTHSGEQEIPLSEYLKKMHYLKLKPEIGEIFLKPHNWVSLTKGMRSGSQRTIDWLNNHGIPEAI